MGVFPPRGPDSTRGGLRVRWKSGWGKWLGKVVGEPLFIFPFVGISANFFWTTSEIHFALIPFNKTVANAILVQNMESCTPSQDRQEKPGSHTRGRQSNSKANLPPERPAGHRAQQQKQQRTAVAIPRLSTTRRSPESGVPKRTSKNRCENGAQTKLTCF